MKLKLILATLAAMSLTACATVTPTTSTKAQPTPTQAQNIKLQAKWYNTCIDYRSGLAAVTTFGQDGFLPKAAVPQVNLIDETVTPLCGSTPPKDLTAATAKITKAITKLSIDEALAVATMKKGATK
jgi:hypothetical protein